METRKNNKKILLVPFSRSLQAVQAVRALEQNVRALEQSVRALGQSVRALGQNVRALEQSVRALGQSVRALEQNVRTALRPLVNRYITVRYPLVNGKPLVYVFPWKVTILF